MNQHADRVSNERIEWIGPPALAFLAVVAILAAFLAWSAGPARADSTVTNCSRDGVQAALSAGGVVSFSCGASPVTINITATLLVTRSVTLDGGNLIRLDGGENRQIISMTTGSALTLTNITLQRGLASSGDQGGAVFVPGAAALTTISATFAGNQAFFGPIENGGAIAGDVGSAIVIRSSTFVSNTAKDNGGALYAVSPVTITDSSFISNSAKTGGAIWTVVATLSGSRIASNTASMEGGGIRGVTTTMVSTIVERNAAPTSLGGGGYISGKATISGTQIISNMATNGGGIWAASAVITSSTILSNATNLGFGGGLYAGQALIGGSMIAGNGAVLDGAGVYATLLAVEGSTIAHNRASRDAGGIFATTLIVAGSTFTNNLAARDGGGAFAGTASITNTTFLSNTAQGDGGGLWATLVFVKDSLILSNTATNNGGGGIFADTDATITGSTIGFNRAPNGDGGGVIVANAITVTRSSIVGNLADRFGGGVYAGVAIISNSLVMSNTTASQEGGGVWTGSGKISGSTFSGNRAATLAGGALFADSADLTNSTLAGNSGAQGGGAVLFAVRLAMTNTTVIDNGSKGISGTTSTLPFSLTNSIVSGPSPNCSHDATGGSFNVVSDFSCPASLSAFYLETPANVGPLQDNGGPTPTMAPLAGSLAINTATAAACPSTDQRGVTRIAPCDIGAYETGIAPGLISLSPNTTVAAGPALTVTINGTGFIPGTVALWNGSPRPTTFVNATTVQVAITQADIASSGVVTVAVRYGQAPDGLSNALPFTITKASQSITFPQPADRAVGDPPFAISATASSGLPVDLVAGGGCTLTGLTVTLTSAGTCTITATQSGNAAYLPAPMVVRSFTIAKASQSITFAALPDRMVSDPPFTVAASASSGLPVTFSATGACTVAGNTVTLTGPGSCTITASQPGNANYAAASSVERTFTIRRAVVTLPAVGKDRPIG